MNKKIAIGVIVIAVLIIGAFIYFRGRPADITNNPPKNNIIVAFGDSLVQGVGASSGHDFVSVLSVKLGQPITNLGVSGNTTADGLARINEVTDLHPGIVILLLGGNDYLKRVPQEETFANLDKIITTLEADGSLVILCGIRGGLLNDHFGGDFAALAARKHTLFVPNVLDGLLGNQQLMSDEVHPNDAGYQKIADKIYPVISSAL